jgi:hypothetical protein
VDDVPCVAVWGMECSDGAGGAIAGRSFVTAASFIPLALLVPGWREANCTRLGWHTRKP